MSYVKKDKPKSYKKCDEYSKKMDVLQTEKELMKQSMNEKDDRIESFEEGMKIRETELIEVYRKD